MKKLFLILCVFGVLFGTRNDDLVKQGQEAYNKQEYKKAIELWQKACNNKIASGCMKIGNIYKYGEGVKKDVYRAVEFYEKACDYGDFWQCYHLGLEYEAGVSTVLKDEFKAFEFYKKACRGSANIGCEELARMYEEGKGVRQDKNKALEIYKGLCSNGDAGGCSSVGFVYEHDFNNKKLAKEFYGRACDLKSGFGCKKYAELNEAGY